MARHRGPPAQGQVAGHRDSGCLPGRIVREDLRLPASYANFYIANESILLPAFADPKDAEAVAILQGAFPTRHIIPIDCRELIWGLGAFHCLTQQQPAL